MKAKTTLWWIYRSLRQNSRVPLTRGRTTRFENGSKNLVCNQINDIDRFYHLFTKEIRLFYSGCTLLREQTCSQTQGMALHKRSCRKWRNKHFSWSTIWSSSQSCFVSGKTSRYDLDFSEAPILLVTLRHG